MIAPRVSFVMPAYNAAETLGKAIASVRGQTATDWELIVVDDGSTDATLALARAQAEADARIRVIAKANGGPASARNLAIAQARGEWLMFHDSDDWLDPRFLERMLDVAGHAPGCVLAACTFFGVDESGRVLRTHHIRDLRDPYPELARTCPFSPIALIVRRDVVREIGGFDESLITCEDWDLWLRLARRGGVFAQTSEALAFYRSRPGSLTRKTTRILEDSRFVIARAHGRDAREPDDAPYAQGADPAGMTDALAQSALYIAATGLGLGGDPRACFDGIDLTSWSFDAKVMAGVIVDAVAYGLAVDRAVLARDWPRTRTLYAALADAVRAATGRERQVETLRAYLEIETRGAQAFSEGFASDLVRVLRVDPGQPVKDLSSDGRAIAIAAIASGGRAIGAAEWIDDGDGLAREALRAGLAESVRQASPRALLLSPALARSPLFWRGLVRDGLQAARARDRLAAARRAVRAAAAAALTKEADSSMAARSAGGSEQAPLIVVRRGGAPAVRAALAALDASGVRIEAAAVFARSAGEGLADGPVALIAIDGRSCAEDGPERAACAGRATTVFVPLDDLARPRAEQRGWRVDGAAHLDAVALLDQARRARAALGEHALALTAAADQDQTLRAALRQAGFIGAISPIMGFASVESNPYELLSLPFDHTTPASVAARRLGLSRP